MRTLGALAVGLVFGGVLAHLGLLLTAAGHGTYLPLALGATPTALPVFFLSAIGDRALEAFVYSSALFWALVFMLVVHAQDSRARYSAVALLVLHYVTALLLLWKVQDDWAHFSRMLRNSPAYVVTSLMIYGVGQFVIWGRVLRHSSQA